MKFIIYFDSDRCCVFVRRGLTEGSSRWEYTAFSRTGLNKFMVAKGAAPVGRWAYFKILFGHAKTLYVMED